MLIYDEKNHFVTIENDYVKREIYLNNSVPVKSIIYNKATGVKWETSGTEPLISIGGIDLSGSDVSVIENRICFKTQYNEICWDFKISDKLPFMETRIGIKGKPVKKEEEEYCEGFGNLSNIAKIKAVQFFDVTDNTDVLTASTDADLFHNGRTRYRGNLFVLTEKFTKDSLIVIRNAPLCDDYTIKAEPVDNMHMLDAGIDYSIISEDEFSFGYTIAIGVLANGDADKSVRQYYEACYKHRGRYIMSNTWGDRNQDKCICEKFILDEISKAAELGADIVQIDDGWQQGLTSGSVFGNGIWSEGFHEQKDFWHINKAKFPNGFEPIVKYAGEKNVKLGLWFSPDGADNYASYLCDAQTMYDFYKKYGIKYFKLDGIIIKEKTAEKNLEKMMQYLIDKTNGDICFNLDITNGKRFGYWFNKHIGEIFVENRYTDWGNYYPHATLRNLWTVSRYIPANKFQFEILNNERNKHVYTDILAPSEYDIDYLFASVMAANPLLWMEMSSLSEDNAKKLKKIIGIYRKYRDDMEDVSPILNKPDGFSITGFKITGKSNNYVLIFKEYTEECDFGIRVREILATNDENADLAGKLYKKRSYLFGII